MEIVKGKFPKIVVDEATKLRELLTDKERKNLNFDTFSPEQYTDCIYGQIGGNCYSFRSVQLIKKSCERVFVANGLPRESNVLNGSPKKSIRSTYWSPIEVFITLATPKMNKMLISFLKQKRKTLPVE